MEKLARTQYSPEFRVTADSKHNLPIAANVLKRKFAVNAPNPAWVSDISYIHPDEGYLSPATFTQRYNATRLAA